MRSVYTGKTLQHILLYYACSFFCIFICKFNVIYVFLKIIHALSILEDFWIIQNSLKRLLIIIFTNILYLFYKFKLKLLYLFYKFKLKLFITYQHYYFLFESDLYHQMTHDLSSIDYLYTKFYTLSFFLYAF